MNAPGLLAALAARGLTVTADGDALRVSPRERLTDELRQSIREHRAELLPLVRRPVALGRESALAFPESLHALKAGCETEFCRVLKAGNDIADSQIEDGEASQVTAADAPSEARRQRVLAILAANPDFRYAVVSDTKAEPGTVVVHVGIRGVGSGEIVIAQGRYDGLELLRALEKTERTS